MSSLTKSILMDFFLMALVAYFITYASFENSPIWRGICIFNAVIWAAVLTLRIKEM